MKKHAKISTRFLENAKWLIRDKGLRTGDIEKKLGVSQGYLSRFNDNRIALDTAYELSKILNTNLIDLIESDVSVTAEIKEKNEEIERLKAKIIELELDVKQKELGEII